MAKKPVIFKPTLNTPQGINNYSGESFRCFTKGDTLPFRFTFEDTEGEALDVTDWVVTVMFSDRLLMAPGCGTDQIIVQEDIPLIDLESATFDGEVLGDKTYDLPEGLIYALARYTTKEGATHIFDMAVLEVYPTVATLVL